LLWEAEVATNPLVYDSKERN